MSRNTARLSTPSTPSDSSSPVPSLSNSPASKTSSLSRSPSQNARNHSTPDKCWIPTLDEISRADPDECAWLFTRLAQEAELDAQSVAPRTPERNSKSSASRYSLDRSSDYSAAVIGGAALDLILPRKEHLAEYSALPACGWASSDDAARIGIEDKRMFSEWLVDVPKSPVTSSFSMSCGVISEDVIAGWAREDMEMETMQRQAQNDILRKLGYSI